MKQEEVKEVLEILYKLDDKELNKIIPIISLDNLIKLEEQADSEKEIKSIIGSHIFILKFLTK